MLFVSSKIGSQLLNAVAFRYFLSRNKKDKLFIQNSENTLFLSFLIILYLVKIKGEEKKSKDWLFFLISEKKEEKKDYIFYWFVTTLSASRSSFFTWEKTWMFFIPLFAEVEFRMKPHSSIILVDLFPYLTALELHYLFTFVFVWSKEWKIIKEKRATSSFKLVYKFRDILKEDDEEEPMVEAFFISLSSIRDPLEVNPNVLVEWLELKILWFIEKYGSFSVLLYLEILCLSEKKIKNERSKKKRYW